MQASTMIRASVTLACLAVFFVPFCADGFPSGAPVDTCVKQKPNRPYHGEAKPLPPETSPYHILASGREYGPGTTITVTISGAVFRGFFMQARDIETNDWVGRFDDAKYTTNHPECAAITHADPKPKKEVTLVWRAPRDRSGYVIFTGTVLESYGKFWSDVVAATPVKK